jgi:MFS-type transporter involved in bile tolerance (Atg22 family)
MSLFTALCCGAMAMLPLAQRGNMGLAALLFVLAQLGYTVATSIHAAHLERLAQSFISAEKLPCAGWAFGFLGGIAHC